MLENVELEYLPIDQAKIGDVVECINNNVSELLKNTLYVVSDIKMGFIILEDLGEYKYCVTRFKLVKTKPASEAKIGDYMIRTQAYLSDTSVGDILPIIHTNHEGLWYNPSYRIPTHRFNEIKVLCTKPKEKLAEDSDFYTATSLYNHTKKENNMNPTTDIKIEINGQTVCTQTKKEQPKTDLEISSKYVVEWYDPKGQIMSREQSTKQDVRKELQTREKLGWTYRLYKIYESKTTDIPTKDLEV